MRKRKELADHTCNLTNQEEFTNWFCMFQQKKTDIYPDIRSGRANGHIYQHKEESGYIYHLAKNHDFE